MHSDHYFSFEIVLMKFDFIEYFFKSAHKVLEIEVILYKGNYFFIECRFAVRNYIEL